MHLSPARQRMAARYLPLARSLCRPFMTDWPGRYDELVSAADLALCESAIRYRRGSARFSTYAKIWILYALRHQVHEFRNERSCENNTIAIEALPEGTPRRGSYAAHVGAELEAAEEIEHMIGAFPDRFRPLIRFLFVDGLSQAETAARLGLSRIGVRHRLRAAIESRGSQCA